ncbi:MAG: histidinol dehydrogenase [Patescibacteria group bacterium]
MPWPILTAGKDDAAIERLLDRRLLLAETDGEVRRDVAAIIADIRARGDAALVEYAARFDGARLAPGRLRLTEGEIREGAAGVRPELAAAIAQAAGNIRRFHERQRRADLLQADERGGILALRFVPIKRIGVYVPGGTGGGTPLVSSVLMAVIPAQAAGVEEIAVCTPPRADGSLAPALLSAFCQLGVTEVYRIGGAHAVAALAFGTETVKPVDKICGPGNRYVTEAKRQVFGRVGLDMLAGPSEVAIVADASADPALAAADLLAQAEHDPDAGAVLFTPARSLALAVAAEIEAALASLSRAEIARASLAGRGGAVITRGLDEALALAERMAPEHLELLVADPWPLAGRVRSAGAVFIGAHAPEALGDYAAGTNHVLPTNGTARYASGLGVDDFLRRMSVLFTTPAGFAHDGPAARLLAREEGLTAHELSLARRLEKDNDK